jgi:hypothetical protein
LKPKHNPKRADPPRDSYKTKQFTKDWARLLSSGRYDLARAKEVMLLLISSETLGPEWQDHALNGEYAYGNMAFTVPLFDEFMKRAIPTFDCIGPSQLARSLKTNRDLIGK